MDVKIRKGSIVTVPLAQGMSLSSSAPSIVSVSPAPHGATVNALAAGVAGLTLTLASDLSVTLTVTVTA